MNVYNENINKQIKFVDTSTSSDQSFVRSDKKYSLRRELSVYGIISLVIFFCSLALYMSSPIFEKALTFEGRLIETLTVFCFLIAALKAAKITLRAKNLSHKFVGAILFLLSIIFLLDESSFGRKYFIKYNPPKFLDTSIDAIHDIPLAIFRHYQVAPVDFIAISVLAAIGLTVIGVIYVAYKFPFILRTRAMIFSTLCLVLLSMGALIDSDIFIESYKIRFIEEQLEFLASIAMIFAARSYYKELRFKKSHPLSADLLDDKKSSTDLQG